MGNLRILPAIILTLHAAIGRAQTAPIPDATRTAMEGSLGIAGTLRSTGSIEMASEDASSLSGMGRVAFEYREPGGSRIFTSIDGGIVEEEGQESKVAIARIDAIHGGFLVVRDSVWLAAGPGRMAGPLSALSGLLPGASIAPDAVPISLSAHGSSSTLMAGLGGNFGRIRCALMALARGRAGMTPSGTPYGSLGFMLSTDERDRAVALVFTLIDRTASFSSLGWHPDAVPEPAMMLYRCSAGFSLRSGAWKVELRASASAGRIAIPGAGFGCAASLSGHGFTLDGGANIATPGLRKPDGGLEDSLFGFLTAFRWKAECGNSFSLRLRASLAALSSFLNESVEAESESESESEGLEPEEIVNEALVDGTYILSGWSVLMDGSMTLPSGETFRADDKESGAAGGKTIRFSSALRLDAVSIRASAQASLRMRRLTARGVPADFESTIQGRISSTASEPEHPEIGYGGTLSFQTGIPLFRESGDILRGDSSPERDWAGAGILRVDAKLNCTGTAKTGDETDLKITLGAGFRPTKPADLSLGFELVSVPARFFRTLRDRIASENASEEKTILDGIHVRIILSCTVETGA